VRLEAHDPKCRVRLEVQNSLATAVEPQVR